MNSGRLLADPILQHIGSERSDPICEMPFLMFFCFFCVFKPEEGMCHRYKSTVNELPLTRNFFKFEFFKKSVENLVSLTMELTSGDKCFYRVAELRRTIPKRKPL